jgi:hypothetical protein
MPLVEQELLILPEFTQGFNGVHIARSLVSCFLGGGGGKSPILSIHQVDRYFSGQWNFEGASYIITKKNIFNI